MMLIKLNMQEPQTHSNNKTQGTRERHKKDRINMNSKNKHRGQGSNLRPLDPREGVLGT